MAPQEKTQKNRELEDGKREELKKQDEVIEGIVECSDDEVEPHDGNASTTSTMQPLLVEKEK